MVEVFNPPPPPNPRPAIKFSRPVATGATVTIACKLPAGIILRVFDWQTYSEPRRDGTVGEAKRAIPIANQQFTVKGPWIATAGQAYNRNNGAVGELLPGGYAITEGCPKEIWDRWYEQNQRSKLVQNGVIFAYADRQSVVEEVMTRSETLSGLEPLDRANPGARMGGVDRRLRLSVLEQAEPLR